MGKKSGPKLPQSPSLTNDFADLSGGMAGYYSTAQQYNPLFGSLNLQGMDQTLNGVNGQAGLLSQFADAQSSLRESNRLLNPGAYGLLDTMTAGAGQDLALGNQLNPNQTRLVQQSARQGQAARGMGYGPSDVFNESLQMTGYGDQLEQQRRAYAAQVLGLNQSMYNEGNQAQNLLGVNAAGLMGQAQQPMNTLLPMAHDNSMTYWNAMMSKNTGAANAKAGATGAGIGAAGMIGAAVIM